MSTSRLTGIFYLGLAITGVIAFLFVRDQLLVEGDAVATSTNLVKDETLARLGISAEIAVAGFQALVALWFFRLFRQKNSFVAGQIAAFGLINTIVILTASAMWITALNLALSDSQPEITMLLFDIHENLWLVGKMFFGLWLLPMAYMAYVSKLPRGITLFLVLGGVGYVLSTFTAVILPDQTGLTEALPIAATVGEFWMIGYLLFKPKKLDEVVAA